MPEPHKAPHIRGCRSPHPHPGGSRRGQGPCLLPSCLLAFWGSLSPAFLSVPFPEIPGLPPVLLWERAQQKATMVAIRTRKATPAPTATPMMTAIGTDSVGEKQAQLMRDLGQPALPPGPHSVPWAQPLPHGGHHSTWALLGEVSGAWAGTGMVQYTSETLCC